MVTCICILHGYMYICTCILNCGVGHVCPFFKSTYIYNDIHCNIMGQSKGCVVTGYCIWVWLDLTFIITFDTPLKSYMYIHNQRM